MNKQPRLSLDHDNGEDWQPGKFVFFGIFSAVRQNTNKFQLVDTLEKPARNLQLTSFYSRMWPIDVRCGM